MEKIELPATRKVGHLTVLRDTREITPKEFNALTAEERLDIIRSAEGHRKYDLLLAADDTRKLVRRIPAQELFLLITDRGLVNCDELIGLVTPEQFTAFTDFDCWDGDRLDGDEALPWLAALLNHDEDAMMTILEQIDFDFLTVAAQQFVTVVAGPEIYDDDDQRQEAMNRDGGYQVDFKDEDSAKLFGLLFAFLYRNDRHFFTRLLEAIRGEVGSELEDEVYRRRNNRLADLGFPDPGEAGTVFQRIDPRRFNLSDWQKSEVYPPEDGLVAPDFALAPVAAGNLFTTALADGIDESFRWELTYLVNKVISHLDVRLGDRDAIAAAGADVGNYINIGLEYCCGEDTSAAPRILHSTYLQPLFQLGYSVVMRLRDRALALGETPVVPYLDEPFSAFLAGLADKTPRLVVPDPDGHPVESVIGTLQDVARAETRLDRLDMLNELFGGALPFSLPLEIDLDGCRPTEAGDLTLAHLLLTALCNQVLGREFAPKPIPEDELPVLHQKLGANGDIDEELHRDFCTSLDRLAPGAGAYAAYVLELLEDDLLAVDPVDLDPRFIGRLIIKVE